MHGAWNLLAMCRTISMPTLIALFASVYCPALHRNHVYWQPIPHGSWILQAGNAVMLQYNIRTIGLLEAGRSILALRLAARS